MSDIRVALAGNPNVGKSTIFNTLTGLHQHTGNWSGKTVDTAVGCYNDGEGEIEFVDLPGTYSLYSLSPEERIAGEYIEGGEADATVVVCDASALERNLILALQVLSITKNTVVCVNLLDEAERHGIEVDLPRLSEILGVRVVGTSAGKGRGLTELIKAVRETARSEFSSHSVASDDEFVIRAREIAEACTSRTVTTAVRRARMIDRVFIGRLTGIPIMLLMFFALLWLTVEGANLPSELLSSALFSFGDILRVGLSYIRMPSVLIAIFIDGVYNTTAWVVGVMLPPMAIFFPLFTVLEDLGYLPRVAFNLDGPFRRCGSCGKQALTMCLM